MFIGGLDPKDTGCLKRKILCGRRLSSSLDPQTKEAEQELNNMNVIDDDEGLKETDILFIWSELIYRPRFSVEG